MKLSTLYRTGLLAGPLALATAVADNVTARNPLPAPQFSTDLASPEVSSGARRAADILIPPGAPGFPSVDIPAALHGMPDIMDELDGLSTFPDPATAFAGRALDWQSSDDETLGTRDRGIGTFAILFSVNRNAMGAVGPHLPLAAVGFPFNVQNQATLEHVGGQLFMSLRLFDRTGVIVPPPPLRMIADNNTLVYCDNDCGGVDYNVRPITATPETSFPPGTPTSDTDASMGSGAAPAPFRGIEPHVRFFFSAKRNSPSLANPTRLPGTISGADVYIDDLPDNTGGQRLYIAPAQMGLEQFDDINSLIVFDDGDGFFDPGIDQIIYTLTADSPTLLEQGLGPGDILTSTGFGTSNVYALAFRLGLFPTDVVDALDAAPCPNIFECIRRWAIGYVCACDGDVNCDGIVDIIDLSSMLSAYGSVVGQPTYVTQADFNSDGAIDIVDLAKLLSNFGVPCT